ncbi:hypothetical protein Scep_004148 [Stephania cephalantha]|uniref:WPP domain-containing protein n=1 Tax=Stephania cephalantha TaxID=152367 RepID=A0AAP0KUR1_9MAGN
MSENEEQQHSEVTSPTMAETTEESPPEQKHSQDLDPSIAKKFPTMSIKSITIWPPTQRTRDAVINRLIETLFAPSIISKRYGSLSHESRRCLLRRASYRGGGLRHRLGVRDREPLGAFDR